MQIKGIFFDLGGTLFSYNYGPRKSPAKSTSSQGSAARRMGGGLGFGIDFYTTYFKFSPSIRGIFALTDELVPDNDPASPWTSNINAMRTRGIFINFTFE